MRLRRLWCWRMVIASPAGVVVALGTLFAQAKGLADGGVQVDGQRLAVKSSAAGLGLGQQLTAHPIQLAHVAPPEAAHERPQRVWSLDRAPQRLLGPAGAHRIGGVDAFTTGLINDNKECRPVASLRNVTETLAPGIHSNQRQFRQSIQFCVGRFSPGVNQLFGHDAAPLFQSALHGSQLCLAEAVRVF